ncbi:hypothetical protein RclHR1_02020019 [Rhizophagus clarus]|uniref:Uncharacterized protein n=1 Tax=Rhizophagus clarus TaxID=94130 RepID=A0A2Z6QR01_9GLOM|nr:hypothetical protein RclHR1_02020019 [Rhizophagus clarus]
MYQVLVNWLRKIHGYKITGQWHLEQVCDDGDYHHLYCDLIIKKPNSLYLKALFKLLATALILKLDGHFEQIFNMKSNFILERSGSMQSEIDETNSLKMCIARLEIENFELKKKFVEIEARNAELKARIAKLEDKQTQNKLIKNLLFVSHCND